MLAGRFDCELHRLPGSELCDAPAVQPGRPNGV